MARGGFFSVDSLQSVHVLVVWGDAMTGELLVRVLQYCGALCTLAGSPEEAFRRMDVPPYNRDARLSRGSPRHTW